VNSFTLKLNIETSVGESTPTEAEHRKTPDGHGGPSVAEAMDGGKRPLIEVGVLEMEKLEGIC
jgi:hypothetical protein